MVSLDFEVDHHGVGVADVLQLRLQLSTDVHLGRETRNNYLIEKVHVQNVYIELHVKRVIVRDLWPPLDIHSKQSIVLISLFVIS